MYQRGRVAQPFHVRVVKMPGNKARQAAFAIVPHVIVQRKTQSSRTIELMRIYIDADACPVKDEIYRVAARHRWPVSVVAGNFIRVPDDPLIERIAAGTGMDAADDWIAARATKDDIVVTADIPLASRCVKAGASVIAPNGKVFTEESIGMTLAVRNLMTDLRASGEITGGPRGFSPKDRSAFLSALDQAIRCIQRARPADRTR